MSTRPAAYDDLPAIAEIYAHYVRTSVATFELDPPDVAEWRRRFEAIAGAGLPFILTERVGVVAGYAYCAPWKTRPAYGSTVEDSVYVAPWAVGTGCGTELLHDLLDACTARGIREVIAVIADTGDPASVELHHRFGFADAGRLTKVGFKHDRFIDTLLLQRHLVEELRQVEAAVGRWDACCDGPQLVNPTAAPWWRWSRAWWPASRSPPRTSPRS